MNQRTAKKTQKQSDHGKEWLVVALIFAAALSIRLIGLKFSFPLLTHHDEIFIMDPLVTMSKGRTLDSGHYNKPTQILYTALFFWLNFLSKLKFHQNMGWAYPQNPLFFYYHARLLMAFVGSLVPVAAWKIGKSFRGIDFSLPAAFLTCFYPPYVIHSHYIGVDVSTTLFTLIIILLCLSYLKTDKPLWLILASAMVAVNVLEKYPGALSFFIPVVTLGIKAFIKDDTGARRGWRFFFTWMGISLGVTLVSMLVIAPHLFITWQQVRDALIYEGRSTHLGADNLNWGGNLLFYLREFINNAGWLVVLFAGVGIIALISIKQPAVLLLFYGGGYWVALSKLGLHWERWSLPMMTTLLLAAAAGISWLWQRASRQWTRLVLAIIITVGGALYIVNGLTASVLFTWQDTRNIALEYLQSENITPEKTISEGYSPYLPRTVKTIFEFDAGQSPQIDYVILSSYMYGRYEAEPERYATELEFYDQLRQNALLLREFEPSPQPDGFLEKVRAIYEFASRTLHSEPSLSFFGPNLQIYQLTAD